MLRHKINIEREQDTPDGLGGSAITWSNITASPLRAKITPLNGNESLKAMRLEAKVSHKITIRFRDDLLSSDRINYKGKLMQIRSIIDLEELHKWIEIMADEGVIT
jgi:SPP1 family predicted phage head-tail adaptor